MQKPYKITFIGEAGVGKTSILGRKKTGEFSESYQETIGAANVKLEFDVDMKTIFLDVWDTAGQEHQSLVPIYLRGANVAIIVCSLLDQNSIEKVKKWHQFVTDFSPEIQCILAINKIDLMESSLFSEQKSQLQSMFQDSFKQIFFVSAKTGESIDALFLNVAETCEQMSAPQTPVTTLSERKQFCC